MNDISLSLKEHLLRAFAGTEPSGFKNPPFVLVTHGNHDPAWNSVPGWTRWRSGRPAKYHRGLARLTVSVGWLAQEFPLAFLRTTLEGTEIMDPRCEEFCKERTLWFQQSLDGEEDERLYAD